MRWLFLTSLTIILIGYAFLDRAFAYVGVAPLYIGEVVLAIAVVWLLTAWRRIPRDPLHFILLAFMALGALRTLPYLEHDGLDALRDAVLWGYGLFALALSAAIDKRHISGAVSVFRRVIPFFLLWVPLAVPLSALLDDTLPTVGANSIDVLTVKAGDAGVHLAGVGAFMITGLFATHGAKRIFEALLTVLWVVSIGIVGALNRGGLLAASVAGSALLLRPSKGWLLGLPLVALFSILIALSNPVVEVPGRRTLSLSQIQDNVVSIFTDTGERRQEGTKDFRLQWWGKIVDYTVWGPYFLSGKGFGVNLAEDDGVVQGVNNPLPLRSPHNSNMTVLARMGVPGMGLWIALQLGFGASLIAAFFRARKAGATFWSRVDLWLFAYWLAAIVNSMFDVYLEGPQGGIWFWAIFGLGLAAMRLQADIGKTRPSLVPSLGRNS
ncbi:MAG: O-antigen ligase family protein [Chloroflexota bacterium]